MLVASRWSKVARSEHYRWLHEDPSYRLRFEAADIRYTQTLKDEAVRRAHDGVVKLVLYKGQPVFYRGEPIVEHEYSDHLLIKLLEAGDPDRFNRQKVAPFDENFDYDKMTEGQVQGLLKWLRKQIKKVELDRAERVPKQATEARATTAADRRTPDTPEPATAVPAPAQMEPAVSRNSPIGFVSPFRQDGWPYQRRNKKRRSEYLGVR